MAFVPAVSPPHVPFPPPPLSPPPAPPFGTIVAYHLADDHPGATEHRLPAFVLGPGKEEGSRRLLVMGLGAPYMVFSSFPSDPRFSRRAPGTYEVLQNEDVADEAALVGDGQRASDAPRAVVGMTAPFPLVDPSRPIRFDQPFGTTEEGPGGPVLHGVGTSDADMERALEVGGAPFTQEAPGVSHDVLTDLLSALGVEATEERLTILGFAIQQLQTEPAQPILRPAINTPVQAALADMLRALGVPVTPLRLDEARHAFRYLFSPDRPKLPPQPQELWSILAARLAYAKVHEQQRLVTGCFVVPWEAHTVLQMPLRLLAQAVRDGSDLAYHSAHLCDCYGLTEEQAACFTEAVAAIEPDDPNMLQAMSREANWVG